MSKTIAVLIKDPARQYEGLRLSLGLLLEAHTVHMVVLNHPVRISEEYLENMSFIDEMGGTRVSNVDANVAEHGFEPATFAEIASRLPGFDLVIPF